MNTSTTAKFDSSLTITPNAAKYSDAVRDIKNCLQLAQHNASDLISRESQPKEWFACAVETLAAFELNFIELTKKTIPYAPSEGALKDILNDWLPAAQVVLDELNAPELHQKGSTYSHLNVTVDTDGGESLLVSLLHVVCTQDPDAPKTRLRLELDHQRTTFNSAAFLPHRESVYAKLSGRIKGIFDNLDL